MAELLIIFAKAPEPGQVKTRLTPYLSDIEAARLHEAFIVDILALTQTINVERALACSPDSNHPFFLRYKGDHALHLIHQKGKDLGERMKNAILWGFSKGFLKVVLLGSDAPTLPRRFIQEAFERLDSVSVVLGPSRDGGYYLIGAKSPLPDLFSNINWSTETVLTSTLERLDEKKDGYHLLPFWYDIDRPSDIVFLSAHLKYLSNRGDPVPKLTLEIMAHLNKERT